MSLNMPPGRGSKRGCGAGGAGSPQAAGTNAMEAYLPRPEEHADDGFPSRRQNG